MPDQAIDERRNSIGSPDGISKTIESLGDVQGFVSSVVYYAVVVVVLGYVGATVINITNMTGQEIDDLFPTDIQNFPYMTPVGRTNPSGNSISSLYAEFGANKNPEQLTRATLEFIFPMKRQSFPYSSWFLKDEFSEFKSHTIAQWFASTCAGTFAAWRQFYKMLIVLGKWGHTVVYNVSDIFLFYIYPYILIYLIMLPIVPIIGFILCFFSSTMYNIPGAYIFTFAPVVGILMAIANVFNAGIFNIFGWVMSFIIFIMGFAMGFINMVWFAMIALALWGYTVAFLGLSPLLHKGGMKNVVNEFIKKRKGLMVIYIIIVVIQACLKLNTSLKVGFIVGAVLCFFKIYQMPSSANMGENPEIPVKAAKI